MRKVSLVSAFVVLSGLASVTPSQALPIARMRGVQPVVEIKTDRKGWRVAHERNTLVFGDTVRTGPHGKADLLFNNGTEIALRAGAQVQILAPPTVEKPLVLRVVGALSEIFVRAKGPTEIRTAAGTAAVRGTRYLVRLDSETQTTVTVAEGTVAFYNPQGQVLVNAGQQSSAHVGGAPTPPVAVDVSGLIAWTFDVTALPLPFEIPFDPVRVAALTGRASATTETEPDDLKELGLSQLHGGNAAAAVVDLSRALELAPKSDETRAALALAQASAGDMAAAQITLVAGDATAPLTQSVRALFLLQNGDVIGATPVLKGVVTTNPGVFQAQSLLALTLLQTNDLAGARSAAQNAIKAAPQAAMSHAVLSMAQFFSGDLKTARREAQLALNIDPLSPLALLAYGRSQTALGNIDEGRQAIQQAASLAPDMPMMQRDLGALYIRLDQMPKAEIAFKAVLTKMPNDGVALAGLGTVQSSTGRRKEAQASFDAALAAAPRDASVRAERATFLIKDGQLDLARQETETFLKEAGSAGGAQLGAIFIQLSEDALYHQDLQRAFEYGQRAVQLLPASAPAHYQLGRVFLEQQRTSQAQAQFRFAVTLDPQMARARYALGLTQEVSAQGQDITDPLGPINAAYEGGPSQGLSLRNLLTPGANERIQAAIQDPTVVRTATRSYGDTQIDGDFGSKSTLNAAISHLSTDSDGRGVLGINASRDKSDGVRDGADFKDDQGGFSYGRKAAGSPSGFFVLGQYDERQFGTNTSVTDNPNLGSEKTKKPLLLAGFNLQHGESSRTRLLIGADKPEIDVFAPMGGSDSDIHSLHGEVRHELRLGEKNWLNVGASWGFRGRSAVSAITTPFAQINIQTTSGYRSDVLYLRDEYRATSQLTLTGEIKAIRIRQDDTTVNTITPPFNGNGGSQSVSGNGAFTGLPTLLATYQINPATSARFRFRNLVGGIEDFELLSPSDVFLFSNPDVPTLNVGSRGRSYEMEVNHTFPNASFLELGLFKQSGDNSSATLDLLEKFNFLGARIRYEGILSPTTTYFASGDYNRARNTVDTAGVVPPFDALQSDVPLFRFEAGVQYLNKKGYLIQPSLGYFGHVAEIDDLFTPRQTRGGFTLANIRIGKRDGLHNLFYVEARNLLDKPYVTPSMSSGAGDLGLGRQIIVGFSRRF